jgi:hypothetical protein
MNEKSKLVPVTQAMVDKYLDGGDHPGEDALCHEVLGIMGPKLILAAPSVTGVENEWQLSVMSPSNQEADDRMAEFTMSGSRENCLGAAESLAKLFAPGFQVLLPDGGVTI